MRYNLIENGVYRHFKGGLYTAVCLADNARSETFVVYVSHQDGSVYARPDHKFFDKNIKVQYVGATQNERFKFTGEVAEIPDLQGVVINHTETDDAYTLKVRDNGNKVLVRCK